MAIAFDAAAQVITSGVTSQNLSFTTSGSDRFLIVWIQSNTSNPSGVTYDGVSMSLYGAHPNSSQFVAYYLANPNSGTHNITVSWGSSQSKAYIVAGSWNGAKQTAFPDAVNRNVASPATSLTTSVTTTANNCWLVGACMAVASPTYTDGDLAAGTSTTRRTITNDGGGSVARGLAVFDSNADITPAGSASLQFTVSSNADLFGFVFSLAPKVNSIDVSETVTPTESLVKATTKVFLETESLQDSVTKTPSKRFSETITLAETVSLGRQRSLSVSDTITLVDTPLLFKKWVPEVLQAASWGEQGLQSASYSEQSLQSSNWTPQTLS